MHLEQLGGGLDERGARGEAGVGQAGAQLDARGAGPGGDPDAITDSTFDLDGDWRGRLLALLDDITSSWAPPSAWEGETSMGTPQTPPAPVMGDMIVGELTVHGWDLAVATGQLDPSGSGRSG